MCPKLDVGVVWYARVCARDYSESAGLVGSLRAQGGAGIARKPALTAISHILLMDLFSLTARRCSC
jgi:hypothetical protein